MSYLGLWEGRGKCQIYSCNCTPQQALQRMLKQTSATRQEALIIFHVISAVQSGTVFSGQGPTAKISPPTNQYTTSWLGSQTHWIGLTFVNGKSALSKLLKKSKYRPSLWCGQDLKNVKQTACGCVGFCQRCSNPASINTSYLQTII